MVEDNREERQLEWGISSATDAKVEKVLRETQESSEEEFKESLSLGTCFVKRFRSSIALNAEILARQLTQGPITRTYHKTPTPTAGSGVLSATEMQSVLERLGDVVAGDLSPTPGTTEPGAYTLSIRSSDYARFKCSFDTLGFQSTVSPAEVFRYDIHSMEPLLPQRYGV